MKKAESGLWPVLRGPAYALAVALVALVGLAACKGGPNQEHERVFYSPVFTVDKIYRSMQGPVGQAQFDLLESDRPELVWLTGFRSEVEGTDSLSLPQQFMCHTNLSYRGLGAHHQAFKGNTQIRKQKLFTISQGEYEARFPEGFALPVISNLPGNSFIVYNQLLNVNHKNFAEKLQLRYKNTVYFVRESERRQKIRPLYQALGQVMVSVDGKSAIFNIANPTPLQHDASCSGGDSASMTFKDGNGREFTYHWVLKPGREVRTTLLTKTMLKLEYDTTIHHIVAHMHPWGESLALKDLTTGKILFTSKMKNYSDRIGIEKVDHYSSKEGIPVYKDHEYALISTYNNTSGKDQDAMAIMYFFLLDKKFQMPDEL